MGQWITMRGDGLVDYNERSGLVDCDGRVGYYNGKGWDSGLQ